MYPNNNNYQNNYEKIQKIKQEQIGRMNALDHATRLISVLIKTENINPENINETLKLHGYLTKIFFKYISTGKYTLPEEKILEEIFKKINNKNIDK